jgi:hypothetical protein
MNLPTAFLHTIPLVLILQYGATKKGKLKVQMINVYIHQSFIKVIQFVRPFQEFRRLSPYHKTFKVK